MVIVYTAPPDENLFHLVYPGRHSEPAVKRNEIVFKWGSDEAWIKQSCSWIAKTTEYQRWVDTAGPSVLWLCGGPGKGKTCLSVHVTFRLEHLDRPQSQPPVLRNQQLEKLDRGPNSNFTIYHFFDTEDPKGNTVDGALKSLIWQICTARPNLLKYISIEFHNRGGSLELPFEAWWTIFLNILDEMGQIFCVLDGLDKCRPGPESSIGKFLGKLSELVGGTNTKQWFKLFITSQPGAIGNNISNQFSTIAGFHGIHLDPAPIGKAVLDGINYNKTVQDQVALFTAHKVESLRLRAGWEDDLTNRVRATLTDGTHDDFLRIAFVGKEVERAEGDIAQVEDVLESVPCEMKKVYEQMFCKILEQDSTSNAKLAEECVYAALLTPHPLTPAELGLLVLPKPWSKDEGELNTITRKKIEMYCGGLLSIGKNTVTLFHESSVRRFFEDYRPFLKSRTTETYRLSRRCFDFFRKWFRAQSHLQIPHFDSLTENHLLAYAIRHWPQYLSCLSWKVTDVPNEVGLNFWTNFFLSDEGKFWLQAYWKLETPHWTFPHNFGALHFAAYFGLDWLIHLLLENIPPNSLRIDAAPRTNRGMTPLHWASRNGHFDVVNRLVTIRGLDLEGKGYKMTPLNWAVHNGHVKIARLLLEKGAKVDSAAFGLTPLHWAVWGGNEKLVRVLLSNKPRANIEARIEADSAEMTNVPAAQEATDEYRSLAGSHSRIWEWLKGAATCSHEENDDADAQNSDDDIDMLPDRSGSAPTLLPRTHSFSSLSSFDQPFEPVQHEHRAERQEFDDAREKLKMAKNARNWAVASALLGVVTVIIVLSILAWKTGQHLEPFLISLGWELLEVYSFSIFIFLLWLMIPALHVMGYTDYSAFGAVMMCAAWAEFVTGWSSMLAMAAVLSSKSDDTMSTITAMILQVAKAWIIETCLAVAIITVGQIFNLKIFGPVLITFGWSILIVQKASISNSQMAIERFAAGTTDWTLLAIPCIGFTYVAYAALAQVMIILGKGTHLLERMTIWVCVMVSAWFPATALIWFKPLPIMRDNAESSLTSFVFAIGGHFSQWRFYIPGSAARAFIAMLACSLSFIGVLVAIVAAEGINNILEASRWIRSWVTWLRAGVYKDTPLFLAIQCKQAGIVKILIEAGADLDARNTWGFYIAHILSKLGTPTWNRTAEDLARARGRDDIVDIITHHRRKKQRGRRYK
jgi:ankyrin repeat protein